MSNEYETMKAEIRRLHAVCQEKNQERDALEAERRELAYKLDHAESVSRAKSKRIRELLAAAVAPTPAPLAVCMAFVDWWESEEQGQKHLLAALGYARTAIANARLAAGAEALLVACSNVLNDISHCSDNSITNETIKQIRAAIAAATGSPAPTEDDDPDAGSWGEYQHIKAQHAGRPEARGEE